MRIGVTGAGGYVGRALVRMLVARGHPVTALSRGPAAEWPAGARALHGDVRDPVLLARFAAETDAVAHLAARVHRAADSRAARAECFDVNVGMSRALVDALERAGGGRTLVYASTTAVYGRRFVDATETSPTAPAGAYAESKLAAEESVLAAAARGGIAAAVLR